MDAEQRLQDALHERSLSKKKYFFTHKDPPRNWKYLYMKIVGVDFGIIRMLDNGNLEGYLDFKKNTIIPFMIHKMQASGINTHNVVISRMQRAERGRDWDTRRQFMLNNVNANYWQWGFIPGWGKEQVMPQYSWERDHFH